MDDKVMCPYCGAEMRMLDGEVMLCGYWWYLCDKCISTTPQGESREEAKELALRRHQPENRVLTLKEAMVLLNAHNGYSPVWIEFSWYEDDVCKVDDCELCEHNDCPAHKTSLVHALAELEEDKNCPVFLNLKARAASAKENRIINAHFMTNDEYGQESYGWRCWLRKPTDEERKAVPWDE